MICFRTFFIWCGLNDDLKFNSKYWNVCHNYYEYKWSIVLTFEFGCRNIKHTQIFLDLVESHSDNKKKDLSLYLHVWVFGCRFECYRFV
jgi:hypothetical protein